MISYDVGFVDQKEFIKDFYCEFLIKLLTIFLTIQAEYFNLIENFAKPSKIYLLKFSQVNFVSKTFFKK